MFIKLYFIYIIVIMGYIIFFVNLIIIRGNKIQFRSDKCRRILKKHKIKNLEMSGSSKS